MIAGDQAKCAEILKGLVAAAAGGAEPDMDDSAEPAPPMADAPAPEDVTPAADDMAPEDKKIAASVRALTGRKNADEVIAALAGLKESAAVAKQTAQVVLSMQLKELIRENPTKVASEKQEAFILSQRSIKAAQAYIDTLPEVVARPVEQRKVEAKPEEIRLSESDLIVARAMGTDTAKLLKFKQDQAKR